MPSLTDVGIEEAYVTECQQLRAVWTATGPGLAGIEARRLRFAEAIRNAQASCEIPLTAVYSPPAGGCFLRADTWQIEFGAGYLRADIDDDTFALGATTLYHEARHAEQWYRVAQRISSGWLAVPAAAEPAPEPTPENIAAYCGIYVETARHAHLHRDACPVGLHLKIFGWYGSIWGNHRQHRGEVLRHMQAPDAWQHYFQPQADVSLRQYFHLPEEKDAYEVQDEVLARLANSLNLWAASAAQP